MTQNTTIKVRLHPTAAQAELLEKTFGCCRYIWNRILSDHEEFYAATDQHFLPTPAKYKKEAPFLKEVDSQALVSVHQNLRGAFQRFFDRPDAEKQFIYQKLLECPDPTAALANYRKILEKCNSPEIYRTFDESGFFVYKRTYESTLDEAYAAVAGHFGLL